MLHVFPQSIQSPFGASLHMLMIYDLSYLLIFCEILHRRLLFFCSLWGWLQSACISRYPSIFCWHTSPLCVLCAPPLFVLPGSSIFNTLCPVYPLLLLRTCPKKNYLSRTSLTLSPNSSTFSTYTPCSFTITPVALSHPHTYIQSFSY